MKKFLCDTDGKGCLDTLAAPLVLGENGGTYAASYDRCLEEEQGKYKTFARYFGKDFTLSDLMYLQEWYFCTQERQEIERKGHSACWTLPTGCWGLEVFLSFFLFGFFMAAYGREAVSSAAWLKAADRQILDLLHGFEER